jgi:pimeloyl-ACP methyl ester carboxylesterase
MIAGSFAVYAARQLIISYNLVLMKGEFRESFAWLLAALLYACGGGESIELDGGAFWDGALPTDGPEACTDPGDHTLKNAPAQSQCDYCSGSNAPERAPNIESDTDAFWQARVDALPDFSNATLTRRVDWETGSCLVYQVEFDGHPAPSVANDLSSPLEPVRLRGRLSVPNTAGPHPVVLFLNGFGSDYEELYPGIHTACDAGGIALMNVDYRGIGYSAGGHYPDLQNEDFILQYIDHPEYWSHVGQVLDGLQALRFLLNDSRFCTEGIVVAGYSWGGMTTNWLQILSSRFNYGVQSFASGATAGWRSATVSWIGFKHPTWNLVARYIDDNPQKHADVCRAIHYANPYPQMSKVRNTVMQGWVGDQDIQLEWCRDVWGQLDTATNVYEYVEKPGIEHTPADWVHGDSELWPFLEREAVCGG